MHYALNQNAFPTILSAKSLQPSASLYASTDVVGTYIVVNAEQPDNMPLPKLGGVVALTFNVVSPLQPLNA